VSGVSGVNGLRVSGLGRVRRGELPAVPPVRPVGERPPGDVLREDGREEDRPTRGRRLDIRI
jgi:hypothetical protein